MSLDDVFAEVRDRELKAAERDGSAYPCDACGSRRAVGWFDGSLLCNRCREFEARKLSAEAYRRWR